jgi:hypothetical protein
MMNKDWSYEEVQKKADAIRAIGLDEVYLSYGEMPWHLATRMTGGGSHRLDINTSVWFYGIDPKSGIPLRWSFDIEPSSANGSGVYHIDINGCQRVTKLLHGTAKAQFQRYLRTCAQSVAKQATELQLHVDRELQVVKDLNVAAGVNE